MPEIAPDLSNAVRVEVIVRLAPVGGKMQAHFEAVRVTENGLVPVSEVEARTTVLQALAVELMNGPKPETSGPALQLFTENALQRLN